MPVSNRSATKSELTPYWQSECGRAVVYVGRCEKILPQLQPDQFHAVVTDPPYGLGKEPDVVEVMKSWIERGYHEVSGGGFMGKEWDAFVPQPATWREVVRVMKPGAHLLCFAGARTMDWMTMAIRFASPEIRDCVMWVYGTGYSKGTDVSKAVDKELGAKRQQVRTPMSPNGNVMMDKIGATRPWKEAAKEAGYHEHDSDEPATDVAKEWQGWGTTLKPAYEPVIVARKPLEGNVAQCVMEHSTGGLNIDACRVGTTGADVQRTVESKPSSGSGIYRFNSDNPNSGLSGGGLKTTKDGRWPSNIIHDGSEEVTSLFPQEAGGSSAPANPQERAGGSATNLGMSLGNTTAYLDSGSAARFFKQVEYDREKAEEYWKQGGGGFTTVGRSQVEHEKVGPARLFYTPKADDSDRPHGKTTDTIHPTVKPLDLMRYLVRLVCVRGGRVLDPFMGSGSTGCAAIEEGMHFVGIEQSQEYADIAIGRIKLALAGTTYTPPHTPTDHVAKQQAQAQAARPQVRKLRS